MGAESPWNWKKSAKAPALDLRSLPPDSALDDVADFAGETGRELCNGERVGELDAEVRLLSTDPARERKGASFRFAALAAFAAVA